MENEKKSYCFNCEEEINEKGFCSVDCYKKFYERFFSDYDKEDVKESWLKKLWNKSIFPDKIKARKEEQKIKREIKTQAKKEALKEMQPELVKHFKQQELDKLSGKNKGNFLEKMSKGFEGVGGNIDKHLGLMGGSNQQQQPPIQQPQQPPIQQPQPQLTQKQFKQLQKQQQQEFKQQQLLQQQQELFQQQQQQPIQQQPIQQPQQQPQQQSNNYFGGNNQVASNDKIVSMFGMGGQKESANDKVKRMLGK